MSVAFAILGALARAVSNPCLGSPCRIRAALAETVGLVAPLGEGQVYATLKRLARRGWVERAESGSPRDPHPYRATPLGRAALAEWLCRPPPPERRADELADRVAVLLADGDAAALRRLAARQAERTRALRHAIARREHDRGVDPLSALLLRTARRHLEVDVAWLEETAARAGAPADKAPRR